MTRLFRALCLGTSLLCTAGTAALAQGRGDHDTPATQRQSESGRQYQPKCRTDSDGWVWCRGGSGQWYRHHRESGYQDWDWWNNDDAWWSDSDRVLSRNTVIRQLKRRNYADLRDMKLTGNVYTLKAIDPKGRAVRLRVDGTTGRILSSERR